MNEKQVRNYVESDKLKILLSPLQDDGCSWYRLKLFMDSANALGMAKVETFDPNLSVKEIAEILKVTDAFVFRFYSEAVVEVVEQFKKNFPKVPVIMDTDDDIYTVSPLNNSYDKFGTTEVKLADGGYLWKYGPGFDMYLNRHRLVDYEYCMEQSDAVLTTTLRLAERLKEHNESVAVIPNSIDPSYWPDISVQKDKTIRLVWSGGSSHYEDLIQIKPAIETLMKKYPQLKLIIAGQHFPALTKGLPEDRFEFWRWVKADGHGYRMACINGDIAIAPLRDMEFNYFKSNIKWYEYSALSLPTVAAKLPPYSDEIKDGVNGLLYKDNNDFVEKVSLLIDDPFKRIELAKNAKRWVQENRSIEKTTKEWVDFIKGLVEAKRVKD
jgi:glycosyltransferase involved in cell wall biosynthesis